jgi:hypothetical protein
MRRLVLRVVGTVMFLGGLAALPFPIPFGLLITVIGLVLLLGNSYWAAGLVRAARRRWPKLNSSLRNAGKLLPRSMHRVLFSTDPRRKPKGIGS